MSSVFRATGEQVGFLRESPELWASRLEAAVQKGRLDSLPFIQTIGHAVAHAYTGWISHPLVAVESEESWTGGQFLVRRLPGPLGQIAYLPRAPLTIAPDSGSAHRTRTAFARAIVSLRAEDVSMVRLELGDHVPIPKSEDPVRPAERLVASLRSEWGQDLAQSGLPLHAADCIQPRSSQLIDLRPGIDAVVAAYDPELRRYAAQAAGSGLRAVVASTHDAPIALKEIMDAVAARTGIRKRAAAYYSNLIASHGHAAEVLVVRDERSALLGAHLAIGTMTTATHLMGGATNEGLARRVPVLLQGEAIRRAVERGACEFDLWGLPTLGLATNKAKWGGTAYAYAGAFDLDLDRLRAPIIRAALRMRGFGA